jgi:NAD(P)-dependent dehydrogenase (short-subunit alcohol dehydrogenase family)
MFTAPWLAVMDGAVAASAAGSGPAAVSATAAAATGTTVRHRRNPVLLICSFPSQAWGAERFHGHGVPYRAVAFHTRAAGQGRFGTLAEAAGAIAFLASDDSGFITAAALPLDGGITEAFTIPEEGD